MEKPPKKKQKVMRLLIFDGSTVKMQLSDQVAKLSMTLFGFY